jgi:glycosyltransferase involved in cell wall biosynthesis
VKAQDHSSVEHVVVDGRSTDATVEILKRHEGSYDLKWVSEPDGGPADALDKGARMSTGDVVGLLSSDDLLPPWTTRVFAERFVERPDVDFVYGDIVFAPMGQNRGTMWFNPEKATRDFYGDGYSDPTIFFRRTAFDKLKGLNREFSSGGSYYDFMLRAVEGFRFSRVREAVLVMRLRGDSKSVVDKVANRKVGETVNILHSIPPVGTLGKIVRAARIGRFQARELRRVRACKDGDWRHLTSSGAVLRNKLTEQVLVDRFPGVSMAVRSVLNKRGRPIGWIEVEKMFKR